MGLALPEFPCIPHNISVRRCILDSWFSYRPRVETTGSLCINQLPIHVPRAAPMKRIESISRAQSSTKFTNNWQRTLITNSTKPSTTSHRFWPTLYSLIQRLFCLTQFKKGFLDPFAKVRCSFILIDILKYRYTKTAQ